MVTVPKPEPLIRVNFRLPRAIIEGLEGYAKEVGEKTGMTVNRSDAARSLLAEALRRRVSSKRKGSK